MEARGISFSEVKSEENISSGADLGDCSDCGGALRRARIFADSEITIVFDDDGEERFVNVTACSKCGRARLKVDFETEVSR